MLSIFYILGAIACFIAWYALEIKAINENMKYFSHQILKGG